MTSGTEHYDGQYPSTPLPDDHFSAAERERSRDLGDGSPAVEEVAGHPALEESDSEPPQKQS